MVKNNIDKKNKYFNQVVDRLGYDVDFLRFTWLRKHLEFSNCNDPLFIYPFRRFSSLEMTTDYHHRPIIELFELN
jgi:hypothetical protein